VRETRQAAGAGKRKARLPAETEPKERDMQSPQLLNDVINVLLLLAPAAAVVCLVLAGISLRYEGGGITFVLGGGFTKWMFWCVVFLTLQPLLSLV
jgi:hypothetical protein